MNNFGFIKLDRSIIDWRWFKDVNTCYLFFNLLLMANYVDAEFESHDIKRGQLVTSFRNLTKHSGLTLQQLRTALKHLESTHDITIKTTAKYSIITINNYEKYAGATQSLTSKQHSSNTGATHNQHQYNKNNKYNNYNKNKYIDPKMEERIRIFESKSLFND